MFALFEHTDSTALTDPFKGSKLTKECLFKRSVCVRACVYCLDLKTSRPRAATVAQVTE